MIGMISSGDGGEVDDANDENAVGTAMALCVRRQTERGRNWVVSRSDESDDESNLLMVTTTGRKSGAANTAGSDPHGMNEHDEGDGIAVVLFSVEAVAWFCCLGTWIFSPVQYDS